MQPTQKTEVFKDGQWSSIEFKELKQWDMYRLIDANGEVIKNEKDRSEWIAASNPFQMDDGTWAVNIEPD